MKIKTNILKYKDPTTNGYVSIPVVAGGSGESVDLSNYYTKEEIDNKLVGEVDILPEQDMVFELTEPSMGIYGANTTVQLTDEKPYFVEWDGTVYETTPTNISDTDGSIVLIGNLGMLDATFPNTNEPFVMQSYYDPSGLFVFGKLATFETATTHNIRIYQSDTPNYVTESEVRTIIDEIINEALNSEV